MKHLILLLIAFILLGCYSNVKAPLIVSGIQQVTIIGKQPAIYGVTINKAW